MSLFGGYLFQEFSKDFRDPSFLFPCRIDMVEILLRDSLTFFQDFTGIPHEVFCFPFRKSGS